MNQATLSASDSKEMTRKKERKGAGGGHHNLSRDELHSLLRWMILQRRLEERIEEAYVQAKIGGFCHVYIGQEAVSTGSLTVIRKDDYVITTYRDHGQALVRGMTARAIVAELYGRMDGCSGGKGGSMHLYDRDLNFMGGHGIVGAHVPLGVGAGFAIKYRGGDQICLCYMGESVVNGGAFHEGLNMCALWKLPVVFIIENNKYGMGTAVQRASSVENLAGRGSAYGIENELVDGQDVLAVRDVTARAVEYARTSQRPFLIEARTHRFRGHSMSDAASGTYRSKEELEANMQRDPILLFTGKLMSEGLLEDTDVEAMEAEAKEMMDDASEFADASPEPPPEALFEDVLFEAS